VPVTDQRLALDAPAKINLYLHVVGRRDDGYHLLDSLVAFTEYGDRLIARPADDLTLRIEGPFGRGLAGAGGDNLILRAARALQDASGVRAGAALTLVKNLPVSSGIGGGSTDAAATLRLLAQLWGLNIDDARLSDIGLPIGADVPVCVAGVTCSMRGIGEKIVPVDPVPYCAVVLVNGGEAVSTPAVFAARRGDFSNGAEWETPDDFNPFVAGLRTRTNDLAPAARTVSPVIDDVLASLESTEGCALARLSGSGGTCFGLFADQSSAERAVMDIRSSHPAWWSVSTQFRATRAEIYPE